MKRILSSLASRQALAFSRPACTLTPEQLAKAGKLFDEIANPKSQTKLNKDEKKPTPKQKKRMFKGIRK